MANGQIDVIVAKKAIYELNVALKGVDAINNSIITLSKNVRELNTNFANVKTPKDLESRLKKNVTAQKEVKESVEKVRLAEIKLQQQREKAFDKFEANIEKERKARLRNTDAIEGNKNALLKQKETEERAAKAVIESTRAYKQLNSKRLQAKKDLQDLIVRGKKANQTQRNFQKELLKTQKRFDGYDRRIKKADKATKDFSLNVGNYSSAFGKATVAIKSFVPALGAFTALQIGREIFDVVKELDSLNKSLKQVTDSSTDFVRAKGFLGDLADEAGVQITGLTSSYVKFLAAAKTTNLTAEETENIFRQTAKAGAILGLSTDDINGSFRALEQILSKGKVQAEEIRGQLGERLPGSFQILAKSMGLTTAELSKQLELGNVLSEEVLPGFAEELEKTYGLNAVGKIETLTSSVNRLRNEWVLLIESVEGSEGSVSGFFGFFIDKTTEILRRWRSFNEVTSANISLWQKLAAIGSVPFGADRLHRIANESIAIREHNNLVEQAVELTNLQNDGELTRLERLKIGAELTKLSTEQLRSFLDALKKKVEIEEESDKVAKGSIKALREIIKVNTKLIEETADDTYRNRLKQENLLLAKQIKLLLKIPTAVKAINTISKSGITTEEQRNAPRQAVNEGTAQSGGTTTGESDFLEGQTPTLFDVDGVSVFEQALVDVNSFVDEYGDQLQQAEDITNAFFDNRIERIQQDIDKNNEFFANQIALAEGNEAEQVRLEKERQIRDAELQKKKRKEQERQAIFNKAIAVTETIINTATAVTKALPNIPLAVATGVLGAAQLATIIAQPIPKFKDGTDDAPSGLAIVGDGGKHEYIEDSKGNIVKTPNTDTLVNLGKGGQKIHKDLESLQMDKRYDLEAINNAAVMSSIYNDGLKLSALEIANVFSDTLDKYQGQIQKEIKQGLKGFKSNVNVNVNTEHLGYMNDTL